MKKKNRWRIEEKDKCNWKSLKSIKKEHSCKWPIPLFIEEVRVVLQFWKLWGWNEVPHFLCKSEFPHSYFITRLRKFLDIKMEIFSSIVGAWPILVYVYILLLFFVNVDCAWKIFGPKIWAKIIFFLGQNNVYDKFGLQEKFNNCDEGFWL